MITKPKGTYDIYGENAKYYNYINGVFASVCEYYNYELVSPATKEITKEIEAIKEEPGKFYYNELEEMGITSIGFSSRMIDAEIISLAYRFLEEIGITDLMIKLNTQDFYKYRTIEDLSADANLLSLAGYLKNNSNYKIYHSLDDYLTNQNQLKKLKLCTGKKTILFSNGGHLGFMYTPEFITSLKNDIKLPQTAQK